MNCAMMGSNNGTMTDFEIPPLFEFTQNGTDVKIAPKERFEKMIGLVSPASGF